MKKVFLMLGMACLFMVACNNAPKQEVKNETPQVAAQEEHHHCPFCSIKAEYANWDQMAQADKEKLNQKAFELFKELDAKMAEECCKEGEKHECKHEGEQCKHEGEQCKHEGEQCKHEGDQCKHEGEKQCCKDGMAEMTPEQKAECEAKCAAKKAECEAMKAAWAAFETKTLDEQKDLVLGRIAAMGMGGKCENEGEGHQCQHEEK